MSNRSLIRVMLSGYDHSKIIINTGKLEALDQALDHSKHSLELQIADLEEGAREYPPAAPHLLASAETYRKAIEIIEELSNAIYDHLSGYGSSEYRSAAADKDRADLYTSSR